MRLVQADAPSPNPLPEGKGFSERCDGPILIDVRGLQGTNDGPKLALLQTARAALPSRTLIGLVDPNLPPLSPPVLAYLDTVFHSPHTARQARPECFVRLAPCDDARFTARLLLDPALPSVAITAAPLGAISRYWQSSVDVVTPAETLWQSVSTLRRTAASSRLAVLGGAGLPLGHALRRLGAEVFGPELIACLSPHYGQTLFILTNARTSAPLLPLLRRYGGSAVVCDSCLLAVYTDVEAATLAARELGRPVTEPELQQWRAGIARPAMLLLGEVAETADQLFVHSAWLADEIARRYGRTATLVAPVPDLPHVRAHASGLQAESCIWAVEMLRFWGHEVRLDLACRADERAPLAALAARLGVADLIGFAPGPASVALFLAMRGQESLAALLAAATGRRIASRGVVEGVDVTPDVLIVPDQPSPPLLAETILAALLETAPCDTAQRIVAALGL